LYLDSGTGGQPDFPEAIRRTMWLYRAVTYAARVSLIKHERLGRQHVLIISVQP
jgi:hypothetical protein